jgi:hypothetical protein
VALPYAAVARNTRSSRTFTGAVIGRRARIPTLVVVSALASVGVGVPSAGSGVHAAPVRGTLLGSAETLGRVTLTHKGKAVSSLKAGRYRIVVADKAPNSGLILDRPNFTSIRVTSSPFVGTRTMIVTLTPGGWSYHGAVGELHDFTVTG